MPMTMPAMAPPDMPEDGAGVEDGEEAGSAESDAEGADEVAESVGIDSRIDEVMGVGSELVGAEDARSDVETALLDAADVFVRVVGLSVVAGAALLFSAFVVGFTSAEVVRSGFGGSGFCGGGLGAGGPLGASKNDWIAPPML